MKKQKTKEQIQRNFYANLYHITESVRNFDLGNENEAQRIAVLLRVLLSDTKRSKSLLNLLGRKERMVFFSTASEFIPANMISYTGLLGMRFTVGSSANYIANCLMNDENKGFWLEFNDWWNQIVIDDKSNFFSRKDLVLFVADQDGGAHVDDEIDEDIYNLAYENSVGWVQSDGLNNKPLDNNVIYASLRQIAFEILESVHIDQQRSKTINKRFAGRFECQYIGEKLFIRWINPDPDIESGRSSFFLDKRVIKKGKLILNEESLLLNDGKVVKILVLCK